VQQTLNEKINDNSFLFRNQLPEIKLMPNSQFLNKSHSNFFALDDVQVGEK